ncbi:hypothetical protein UB43_21615 [Pseudomonas sp. 21]|uniref:hypothetical protein n=1 Tax=unclassified Pseudomonas TaxID=196821 RepID=UPI0005EAF3A6|nr:MULTISPECIES: hypothetical protein [unclassified Pseudomonas]KJJ97489.1 hypothetical protein UB43_21615 [Pseudomonas sp. 21]MBV7586548.1 hypothetical protein [Pseudomonas sp. PDM33]
MLRIKGTIGDWPVDLTVEMDDADWAKLAQNLPAVAPAPAAAPAPVASGPVDQLWLAAQDLLRRSGSSEGPQLLDELVALAGSSGAAKGLLVRLRHSPQVKIEVREGVQVFTWVEGE